MKMKQKQRPIKLLSHRNRMNHLQVVGLQNVYVWCGEKCVCCWSCCVYRCVIDVDERKIQRYKERVYQGKNTNETSSAREKERGSGLFYWLAWCLARFVSEFLAKLV